MSDGTEHKASDPLVSVETVVETVVVMLMINIVSGWVGTSDVITVDTVGTVPCTKVIELVGSIVVFSVVSGHIKLVVVSIVGDMVVGITASQMGSCMYVTLARIEVQFCCQNTSSGYCSVYSVNSMAIRLLGVVWLRSS